MDSLCASVHAAAAAAALLRFKYDWGGQKQGLFKGFLPALVSTVALSLGGFFMFIPVTRNYIAKKFLPGELMRSFVLYILGWAEGVRRVHHVLLLNSMMQACCV